MISRFITRCLGAVGITISLVLIYFVGTVGMAIDDSYAQWGAENLVIEYLETHDGQWPRSWEDLRPLYTDAKAMVGGWSFEKFRGRIGIDFEADADELRRLSIETDPESGTIPFHVIWPRWTFSGGMSGGPDARLYWYFRMQAGLPGPEPRSGLTPPAPIPITPAVEDAAR